MIDLRLGDCLDVMATMADGSVHCCVTSPPYFGLRDYGAEGQIGLEATPDAFVAKMVDVFREVRRVLRDDGTLWLNLGDSFNSSPSNQHSSNVGANGSKELGRTVGRQRREAPGLKTKDLIGIPWRVAFALQADGWYLRSDIIWHKPNPMPESVRDRPTKSHEYLFLLSKSATYYYDADAIKEEGVGRTWHSRGKNPKQHRRQFQSLIVGQEFPTRNRRSVWSIATSPFKGAHFATFPPKLIEPCILAGTSEAGCCPACGKPWERVMERTAGDTEAKNRPKHLQSSKSTLSLSGNGSKEWAERGGKSITLGFRPACPCDAGPAVPCTVLDPFNGAGTTGLVAVQHGRSYVGIELNPDYLALSRDRLESAHAVA